MLLPVCQPLGDLIECVVSTQALDTKELSYDAAESEVWCLALDLVSSRYKDGEAFYPANLSKPDHQCGFSDPSFAFDENYLCAGFMWSLNKGNQLQQFCSAAYKVLFQGRHAIATSLNSDVGRNWSPEPWDIHWPGTLEVDKLGRCAGGHSIRKRTTGRNSCEPSGAIHRFSKDCVFSSMGCPQRATKRVSGCDAYRQLQPYLFNGRMKLYGREAGTPRVVCMGIPWQTESNESLKSALAACNPQALTRKLSCLCMKRINDELKAANVIK
ncbi:hypothetical protein MicloDRAFT_00003560 [Microvirga lotononidis]|uniref:Uncharacterized protein n=1 Tax=Microvirga lotononidis TaxID=864069 RepID=I4Z3N7_9HYPH|nr:hypothetical protein MicloDRAFT_00003560 [Microvirga lotononidis]